ncbi:site-specific integrase [Desulfovibrio sp. OttesenSCG-928-C06]|nr:site-specific integrase [Desulfovibrio sp. OttesenSCG-928-C06]
MTKKVSGTIAARSGAKRVKTRFAGVYTRQIENKRTGKPDVAFDISYRDQEGKLRWQLIGYASDGVNAPYANKRRGAILDGISKGEKPKSAAKKVMTYAEAWEIYKEKWLPTLSRPDEEKNRYRRYIEKRLAHRRMDVITTLDLEDLKAGMLTKGLSPASARLVLGDIRRVYRKMALWGLYDGPIPTSGITLPKADNARTRFLTYKEADKLLAAIRTRSKTWHDIAFLSLHTGMRKSEVLTLRGEHLDFGAKSILVKDSKSGSRVVPMTDDVIALLKTIAPVSPTALVFTRRGKNAHLPISADADESFVRAVADCELNKKVTDRRHKVVFHTLRHTYCSWLAMAGVPLYTIGELVGHSSTQITRRYSHLCPNTKQEAASLIGELLTRSREAEAKKAATATHAGGDTTPDHQSSSSGTQDTSG